MGNLLQTLGGMYSFYAMVLVVICGLFALFIDQKIMLEQNFQKEAAITRIVGMIYIGGGILAYIIISILT